MHPVLLKFGNFTIYSYGFMVALGFLAAVYLTCAAAKRKGIPPDKMFDVYLYAMIFGILGARLLHVILEIGYYSKHPLDIIMINHGGLAFQGGLLAGIIAAWLAIKKLGLPLLKTADMMIPYVALAQCIGRIGCFLNGCCYGVPSNSFIAVYSPEYCLPLHPTQLYLSAYFLIMFIVLKKRCENKKIDGIVFAWYLLMFSVGSFFIDFLRGDLAAVFFNLKVSQLISAAIFFVSLTIFGILKWKTTHSR
ncbi:MAG: prolipoprotein diacylglyceryl transferase [Candidatus Omnitrophica bacterium]|nr:prolipoprotein diacylglyceryl transferase [Candidatus Omnitrophota bacterium]